jgi:hypothetical protein
MIRFKFTMVISQMGQMVSCSVLFSDNAAQWNGRASPCQAMARKPEGDLKQARATTLARARFKSDEGGRSETAVRRAKTHHRRENQIAVFSLAQRSGLGRGKHWIARLKNRTGQIQRFKEWQGGIERLGDLSRCNQGGATGVVAATLTRMRIV